MEYKELAQTTHDKTTETRNLAELEKDTGNLYESIAIISKRANQLNDIFREELNGKISEFASTVDNLEEIFENREQIEISRYYESLPKPWSISLEEFMNGNVYHRKNVEDQEG